MHSITTLNSNTISVSGNFTRSSPNQASGGTTNIILNGTGTWSQSGTGPLQQNLTINTSGTITLGSNLYYDTGTLTYTTGNVITSGNTLTITSLATLNTNGIIWDNITHSSGNTSNTITLTSNLTCRGSFTTTNVVAILTLTGNTFFVGGSFIANSMTSGTIVGTTNIVLNGTGTLSTNSTTTGGIRNNITINTTGAITLGTLFVYGGGTFTYTQGTIFTTTNNNFAIVTSATLINMNDLFSNRVTVTSGITLTMNEFFSGRAGTFTTITPSSTTNYTITFQDRFEKFSRFIKISNATISNRGQLMVLSDDSNQGNNVSIRFAANQLANGIPKNNPNGINQNVFSVAGLIKDPCLS